MLWYEYNVLPMTKSGLSPHGLGIHYDCEPKAAASRESLVSSQVKNLEKSNTLVVKKSCLDAYSDNLSILATSCGTSQDAYQAKQVSEKLETQFGFENFTDMFSNDIVNIVENFVALCASLADCRTARQAVAIIFLYVKTHYHNSVISVVKEFLLESELFTQNDLSFVSCDGDLDDEDLSDNFDVQIGAESWLNLLGSVKNNWALVRKSPSFVKISKLLSMSAALGLCNLSKLQFDVAGIRVFSVPTHSKHVNAIDFATACIDTIEYFVKGGYECFRTRSFDPLLFEDIGAQQFEEEFFRVVECSGAVKCGNLEKLTDLKENDYADLLDKLIEQSQQFLKSCPSGFERKVLADRHSTLRKLRMDFTAYRVSGKLREAPFAIYLHGSSGVGKSYVSALLSRLVLKMNGFDASDDRFMVLNEADKFLSTAKSSINCIVIDDMGNSKPDFVEKAPTQKIIELCNNVPYYANMADIEQKGKVSMEPKVLMMTSNLFMDRLAGTYSQDLMSIVRRANVHIEQFVHPDFCQEGTEMLDSAKVRKAFGDDPYPDVWQFRVYHAVNANGRVEFVNFFDKGSLADVIALLNKMTLSHFANQRFVVENSYDLASRLDCCELCHMPSSQCNCHQVGVMQKLNVCVRDSLMNHVPDCIFNNQLYQLFLSFINFHHFYGYIVDNSFLIALVYFYCFLLLFVNFMLGIVTSLFFTYLFVGNLWKKHRSYISEIALTRGQMPSILSRIREYKMHYILGSCAILAILYKSIRHIYSLYRITNQGTLTPSSMEDVKARDSEANPWVGAYISPSPQSAPTGNTFEQLNHAVEKNLCYMRLPNHPKGVACCDSFFLKSNLAVVPDHMWYDDTMLAEFYSAKAYDNVLGEDVRKLRNRGIISKVHSYLIPNTDFRIVYIPSCGTWKDFTPFLPDGHMPHFTGALVYRDINGDIKKWTVTCDYKDSLRVGSKNIEVYKYQLPEATFKGLCIATLVTNTKESVIAGFHLGGRDTLGVSGIITKKHVLDAEAYLSGKSSVLLAHSEGDMEIKQYDVQTFTGHTIHRNSCINHLPLDNSLKVYGSTIGRSTYRSDVITTPISETVEEVLGVPNQWGPPKFHPWKPFYECIKKTSNPSIGVDPIDLEHAVDDYVQPLEKLIVSDCWKSEVRPLTKMETLCGIDGKRFIDKMPPNTAIGFPLTGPKNKYMTALDPAHYPEFNCPMDIEPRFWDEVSRIEQIYLSGKRAYPTFKASLKDEPTKLTKDKVRVFFAAPFALQALVRKYFLPICRFLSMNPLISECAVGINSQGPEWDQLVRHMKKFGDDRIFAGDYSSYDTRMSAQLGLSSWGIFIILAKATGNYSDDDIKIMEGLATDCCYPVVAYNGDLVEYSGVHISGINLTAYVGSIDNSLLQRSGYYNMGRRQGLTLSPYRTISATVNYGDDFKGSISKAVPWFNHITYKQYLAEHDIILTMPDKTSDPTEYMIDSEADFLKRHNIYNSELGLYFGALDKNSIYKSLHTVLKSKAVTPQDQSAMNIDGALREMFAHGREEYELFRTKITEVADKTNLRAHCLLLDSDYDDRMLDFKIKYLGFDPLVSDVDSDIDDDCVFQSGFEDSKNYALSKHAQKILNAAKDEKHTKSMRDKYSYPDVDPDRYAVIKRNYGAKKVEGLDVRKHTDRYIVIPKNESKENFLELIHYMGKTPCFYQDAIVIEGSLLGDIDIGFVIDGGDLAIFEVKATFKKSNKNYAKKQAISNLRLLTHANPHRRIHTFTLRGNVIKYITSNCELTKKQKKLELFST